MSSHHPGSEHAMSEYCDYYAVRADDPNTVVPALAAAGVRAVVFDVLVRGEARPAWVALAVESGDMRALRRLGPVIHVRKNEGEDDTAGWQLSLILPADSSDDVVTHTFFEEHSFWFTKGEGREPPDGFYAVAPRPLGAADLALLARTFGPSWEQVGPSLRPGGFWAFVEATGLPPVDLLDQHFFTVPPGGPAAVSLRDLPD